MSQKTVTTLLLYIYVLFSTLTNFNSCLWGPYGSVSELLGAFCIPILSPKTSTARFLWFGDKCAYRKVISIVLCPKISRTVFKSIPAITKWLAAECLRSWKRKSFIPDFFKAVQNDLRISGIPHHWDGKKYRDFQDACGLWSIHSWPPHSSALPVSRHSLFLQREKIRRNDLTEIFLNLSRLCLSVGKTH